MGIEKVREREGREEDREHGRKGCGGGWEEGKW